MRFLGGIDLLVDLLASDNASLSVGARLCLASLRQGNARNAAEVVAAIRRSADLAGEASRLVADLMHYDTVGTRRPALARWGLLEG